MGTDAPAGAPVASYLRRLHERHAGRSEGAVADYIPELGHADPSWFGICLVTTDGAVYEVGDTRQRFSIQSISKPFSYGTALEEVGERVVREHVGVEPTGEAYNSIRLHPRTGMPLNPMVNAGAIAVSGLIANARPADGVAHVLHSFGTYAGRELTHDETLFRSEMETGHRNRAVAHLLRYSGSVEDDPEAAMECYVRACATEVDTRDLAAMGATLANGGTNPVTGEVAASEETVRRVLTVMTSCGMYDGAGEWLYTVGLPAKSGVSGGIVAVLPGRFGVAVFSPPLDQHGNSERGIAVCRDLSREMDLHLVASGDHEVPTIRAITSVAEVRSRRQRTDLEVEVLHEEGDLARVFELQGDLDFPAAERVTRELATDDRLGRIDVVDLRRVDHVTPSAAGLLLDAAREVDATGGTVAISGARHHPAVLGALERATDGPALPTFVTSDRAREWAEDQVLEASAAIPEPTPPELDDFELTTGLTEAQRELLAGELDRQHFAKGTLVLERDGPTALILVLSGRLSLLLELEAGAPQRIVTVSAGGTVGELSLLGSDPRVTDVHADTDVDALVLPPEAIERVRDADPELRATLMENLLRMVGRRADDIRRQVAALGR